MKRTNKTNTQAIIDFEARIKAIIAASKKDVSEMTENELIILYDMLRDHKEWLWYLKRDHENVVVKVVEQMTECFEEYMDDAEDAVTGFEEYPDKCIIDGAYDAEHVMYDIIDAYFEGKRTRDEVNLYWSAGYSKYFVELVRRVEKLDLKTEASEWDLTVCAKSRKYLAVLKHHKYTNEICYEVAKAFWNEFEEENYVSYEQSIEEYEEDIKELKEDLEMAKVIMKNMIKDMERESLKRIKAPKKYNNGSAVNPVHVFMSVFEK